MPEIPEAYRAAVLEQQRELAKLVRSAGLEPVKRLYEQMMTDVARRIRRVGSGSMTHMQARGILAQIKLGLARIMQAVNGKVGQAAVEVGIASARQMLEDVARLERHFTGAFIELPVLEVATLHGIVHEQASSLMRVHETSMARYGVRLVERMEGSLAASIASGETHGEAADGIIKIAGLEWHAAERIVRCLPGDAIVTGCVVRAVHRRWFDGDLVEVITKSGRKLAATANHPVLTRRGWLGAGLIKQGDYLLCSREKEHTSASRDQHVTRRPSKISEVFDTASAVGVTERRHAGQPDFHGDIGDGDVDIARPNRKLLYGVFAEFTKPSCEHLFSPPDMLSGGLGFCALCTRLLPSERACRCLFSDLDAASSDAFVNNLDADVERSRYLRGRFTGSVSSNDFINRRRPDVYPESMPLDRRSSRIGHSPHYAGFAHISHHDLLTDRETLGDLSGRCTGFVELDYVTDIRRFKFSGHVFNVTTDAGYFHVDGFTVGNTELSYVANASSRAAADEQAEDLDGDLWTRWSEYVSDSGVKLDDRVGLDSVGLHGQVAPPGGMFTEPPTTPRGEKIDESLAGKQWKHPPNRPNDRGLLVPWRAHWKVPGWIWRDGRRVYVTQAMARAMSTHAMRDD